MNLLDKIKEIGAVEGKTTIRVDLLDGHSLTGLFTEYTYAEDNEEEIASINIRVAKGEPEYGLLENEIRDIQIV